MGFRKYSPYPAADRVGAGTTWPVWEGEVNGARSWLPCIAAPRSSCPGRGAALLQRCTTEPGPILAGSHQKPWATAQQCGASGRTASGANARYEAPPRSEQPVIDALLPCRALPDHAGKAFQRHQRLARVGPLLQLLDGDMIERLAAGTA